MVEKTKQKKKILITGAKGQLGKAIVRAMGKDFKLILTDIDNLNITNKLKVIKFIKLKKPDLIIHAAAYTKVDDAQENQKLCRKINADGTKNIAKSAQEIGATLIYISTDYVFDGKKKFRDKRQLGNVFDGKINRPYAEKDMPKPLSVYGQTKLEGEKYVKKLCDKYYILRTAWVFGEGKNFIETMLKLSKDHRQLNIVNDQIGSPTYTKDLAVVIGKIISSDIPYGIYNFSGEKMCSWYDFAVEIFKLEKIKIIINPIKSVDFPQKARRPAYSYLDKTKIKAALKIKIKPWHKMLQEYLEQRT